MAFSTIKDVRCQLCSEYYTDPRILPCLHSFCRGCLEKLIRTEYTDSIITIVCPTCRTSTPTSSKETSAFPRDLHLAREAKMAKLIDFLTMQNLFCDGCPPSNRCSPEQSSTAPVCEQTSGTIISSEHGGSPNASDHAKAFCCNCNELLCQLCWDHHRHHRRYSGHHIVVLGSEVATQVMSSPCYNLFTCCEPGHEGEALNFYCTTCSDAVCCRCKTAELHRGHSYKDAAEVAKEGRDKMNQVLDSARVRVTALTDAVNQYSDLVEEVEHIKVTAAAVINDAFVDVQRALEERRKVLLASLEELVLSKSEAIKLHMEALDGLKQAVSKCSDMVTNVYQMFSDEEVAAMKGIFPDRLQNILDEGEIVPLHTNVHRDILVAMDTTSLIASIKQLGNVDDISPEKCTWAMKPPFIVNVESKLEVETRTSGGVKWACAGVQVQAELRSKVCGSEEEVMAVGQVINNNDGTYTITLTASAIGVYSLQVTVDGEHIHNSPCDVHVVYNYSNLKCTNQIFSCASYTTTVINYMLIYSGRIYLSVWHRSNKYYYCNVSVYSLDGKREQTIGSYGNGRDNFDNPHGIAIEGDRMYVADTDNDRIQQLTISGTFVRSFGKGQLKRPKTIATNSNGEILVCNDTSEIQVFLPNGDVAENTSCAAPPDGSVKSLHIYDITVDSMNNIHIALQKHILVYSLEGCYIRKYGSYDSDTRVKFSKSENGCTIVCYDSGYFTRFTTQIFDMFGNQICSLEGTSSAVAIDQCGNMYVASSGGHVMKWTISL